MALGLRRNCTGAPLSRFLRISVSFHVHSLGIVGDLRRCGNLVQMYELLLDHSGLFSVEYARVAQAQVSDIQVGSLCEQRESNDNRLPDLSSTPT